MNRRMTLSVLMALALGSSQVLALDLGQVKVKSALGQPLLAEIPLQPANPAELEGLTAQLASREEFARAGIVGGRTTIPLEFAVVGADSGHPVIRITSTQAVNNPYLDLLIVVNGKAGRSVREYAILLDPPGGHVSAPVTAAPASQPVAAPQPAPSPAPASKPAATPATDKHAAPKPAPAEPVAAKPAPAKPAAPAARPARSTPAGDTVSVQSGETLSGIARDLATGGASSNQMMLALQKANPEAFYRDNINALKAGAVLRVPSSAEAKAISMAAAAEEVRRQNGDWSGRTPLKPTMVADAAARSGATAGTEEVSRGDHLSLVPAKQDGSGSAGQGGTAAGVRQDLLRAKESLASMQQQSDELKSRLQELADINAKNERLLSLKDNQIAALQAQLADARKAANLPPLENVPASGASSAQPEMALAAATDASDGVAASSSVNETTLPAVAASSAEVATALATSADAGAAETANKPEAAKPAVAPVAKTDKAASKPAKPVTPAVAQEPWYMQTWAWAAGAGAIVVLVLLAVLGRRKKPEAKAAGGSSLADRFGNAPAIDFVDGEDADQNELLDQLAEHPEDIESHLELVSLYYARRDVEHFEAAAEAMYAHVNDPAQDEWQDVVRMGEDLAPGHPLFDHHPEEVAVASGEGFNLDDFTEAEPQSGSGDGDPRPVSEYNFNFDLTRASASAGTTGHDAPALHDDFDEAVEAFDKQADEARGLADTETTMASADNEWHFDAAAGDGPVPGLDDYSDDPVDTKLDLARAYLDMGDPDGARAMLGEVLKEGSQVQQDTARRLLEGIA